MINLSVIALSGDQYIASYRLSVIADKVIAVDSSVIALHRDQHTSLLSRSYLDKVYDTYMTILKTRYMYIRQIRTIYINELHILQD